MIDTLIMFVLALYALARGERGSSSSSTPQSNADDAADRARRANEAAAQAERDRILSSSAEQAPAPWPQAVPPGLPNFPGGWEYAEPPSPAVRERAWQLLDALWKQGNGSRRVELTSGEWITYRAEITKGAKRGVVAYRIRKGAAASKPAAPKAPPRTASPGLPQPQRSPASSPAPLRRTEAGKPWLHQGAGMGALASLAPYVREAQQRLTDLKYSPGTVDGKFGAKTFSAVKAFQTARGLKPDGIVGDNTWAALEPAGSDRTAWNVQVGPTSLAS